MFSVAHLGSPGATAWTTLLFSAHSLLMVGCFMLTRRIWLVWEGLGLELCSPAVFGIANSGRSDHITFVTPRISGPDWLTGGAYGIEGSWLASALILPAGVTVMRMAVRRRQIVWTALAQISRGIAHSVWLLALSGRGGVGRGSPRAYTSWDGD